jgi:hypothetical protein
MRDRKSDAHTKVLTVKPNEIRHHRDEDKSNNTPENLTPMTRGAHTRLHNQTRKLGRLRKALTMQKRGEKLY